MSVTIEREFLTPPEAAEYLGVSPDKILAWIHAGELRASDLSTTRGGRPRWRIAKQDLAAFLSLRAATPEPKRRRTPRRQAAAEVIQFYK